MRALLRRSHRRFKGNCSMWYMYSDWCVVLSNGLIITRNCFRDAFTQQTARMAVDALSARNRTVRGEPRRVSLCDLGYCRVGIDEGYEAMFPSNHSMHDSAGFPLINKATFPDIAGLVAYAHSKPPMKMEWYLNSCWHGGPKFNTTRNYEGDVRALQTFKFVSSLLLFNPFFY